MITQEIPSESEHEFWLLHLDQVLKFLDATDEEKDYSIIGTFTADTISGTCGHCESRCPFGVKQESRMEEINRYFG